VGKGEFGKREWGGPLGLHHESLGENGWEFEGGCVGIKGLRE